MRSVCDIRHQKPETHRKNITTVGNLIDYPGEVRTPTSYLTTMKTHVTSTILDATSRYMYMDVKYLYLNNQMDRDEYIMIQISMKPQEFVENTISQKNHTIDTSMQG